MEDKELVEKITKLLYPVMCSSDDKIAADMARDYTDDILSLIRPTGYVQLAEDQKPPDADDEKYYNGMGFNINLYHSDWLTPHKEGERSVKWVKVICD